LGKIKSWLDGTDKTQFISAIIMKLRSLVWYSRIRDGCLTDMCGWIGCVDLVIFDIKFNKFHDLE
jgi:hypothetical protein